MNVFDTEYRFCVVQCSAMQCCAVPKMSRGFNSRSGPYAEKVGLNPKSVRGSGAAVCGVQYV